MKIESAADHEEALEILSALMDDEENSSDVDMQALAKDIEAYEEIAYPLS